jgi:hypothetical protein
MLGLRRPYDLALAFAAGALTTGLGFSAVPLVASGARSTADPVAVGTLAPVTVAALPELPSRDSIAAMLVSGPPGEGQETRALLRIIDGVEGGRSHDDLAVLEEIAGLESLDSSVVTALTTAAGRVGSSSTRDRLLRTIIRRHRHAVGASRRPVLDAIRASSSTSSRAATLELFVSQPRLSEAALIDAFAEVGRLPAEDYRSRVLGAAARANRIEGRARSAYLGVASRIRSSRERSRAMAALDRRSSQEGD